MATHPVPVTTREMVKQMVEADPSVTVTEMAAAAGVSLERVRQILLDLGYKREWVQQHK
jgi:ApbE superfamily uncharacterized protein (UPF0280 family)